MPDTSDVFQNCILAPLQSAYLYEESKQSFRYKSAVLIKNPVLEEKVSLSLIPPFNVNTDKAALSSEACSHVYSIWCQTLNI